jgi:cAMP-dependent protein kinase regulator
MEGGSADYIAKHDLERLFRELTKVLAQLQPERPILSAVTALESLVQRREQGDSVSNYQEVFKSALCRTPSRPSHNEMAHSCEEDFAAFNWDSAAERKRALDEAPSTAGWSETAREEAARAVSGGPVRYPPGFNAGRRYSISAEPYTPSEQRQFHRVVIEKDESTKQRIRKAVQDSLLFRNLDDEQLAQIIDAMFEKRVPKDVELIRQGDEGDFFYTVNSGSFVVLKDGERMVEYGAGDTFGELALMYGSPRLATVKALEDSVVWAVDRATFRGIVIDLSFRKRRLYEGFLRSVPLLHTLHDSELYRICDALQPAQFPPNSAIVQQGETGHEFYIIETGAAIVTMGDGDGQVEVAKIGPGDYFGELALIYDAPRAATVRSVTDVKCVTLSKADFIRLLGPVMPILQRNQEHYRKYEEYLTKA